MQVLRLAVIAAFMVSLWLRPAVEAVEMLPVDLSPSPQQVSLRVGSVGEMARRRGMYVGAAVHPEALSSLRYRTAITEHFTSVTPENGLKLGRRWRADGFDWSDADAVAAVARAAGIGMRVHTFVWEQPDGILPGSSSMSPAACQDALLTHIRAVIDRYSDIILAVDVVNEPLNERGYVVLSRWSSCLGTDPIAFAFQAARDALDARGRHDVPLAINEFGVLTPGRKADALLRLARDLRDRGVPLDTIAVQAHLSVGQAPKSGAMEEMLGRYAGAGFKVEISELDISVQDASEGVRGDPFGAQADLAEAVVRACLRAAGDRCLGITTWGVTDDHHWRLRLVPGSKDQPLLLDAWARPKPAYAMVARALSHGPVAPM